MKEELAKLEKEQMKVEQILALISRMEATGNLSLDKQLIKQKAIKTKNEYNIRIPEIKARLTELKKQWWKLQMERFMEKSFTRVCL